MVLAIFGVSLILMIIGIIAFAKTDGDGWLASTIIFCIITLIFGVFTVKLGVDYANIYSIDSKLEIYEQENLRIRKELGWLDNCIVYEESDIKEELKDSQLALYYLNASEIAELKLEKAELKKTKWLLFFGR